MSDEVYEALKEIVGPEHVSDEPEILVGYSRDMSSYSMFDWDQKNPNFIVCPKNTSEVKSIISVGRRYDIPIIPKGSGTNLFGWTIPREAGILVDLQKRMNDIIEIDEDSMTATVQAGVRIQELQVEAQKRGMFIHQPGAPSTVTIGSHYTHGFQNKAGNRLGVMNDQIVGYRMVLGDGTELRTGSKSDSRQPDNFWMHGPGPDLGHIPRYAEGTNGIATEVTLKLHPLDENVKAFWVSFNDFDNASEAFKEFVHKNICTGSCLYSGFKYAGYTRDTNELGYRMNRIHPEFQLITTLQGTDRRIEYEEKELRKIAEKHDGRVIPDQLPFYQRFVDTQINNASSSYSEYVIKYFGSPGTVGGVGGMVIGTLDKLQDLYRIYTEVLMNDPNASDPNYLDAAHCRGMILYPTQGGHWISTELFNAGHTHDPKINQEIFPKAMGRYMKRIESLGLAPDQKYSVPRHGDLGLSEVYIDLWNDLREVTDPDKVMNKAAWENR